MSKTPTWEFVIADMWQRNQEGKEKYNRYLDVTCPDNLLQHAYEEALDLAVYLKTRLLQEKDANEINKQLPLDLGDFK